MPLYITGDIQKSEGTNSDKTFYILDYYLEFPSLDDAKPPFESLFEEFNDIITASGLELIENGNKLKVWSNSSSEKGIAKEIFLWLTKKGERNLIKVSIVK